MVLYRIAYLLLINIILFPVISQEDKKFSHEPIHEKAIINLTDKDGKALFKSSLDVLNKHFSGIIVFKKVPRDTSTRIVFLSEVGLTLFDMEYKNGEFEVIHCMPAIDKPRMLQVFMQFFELLLKPPADYHLLKKKGDLKYVYKSSSYRYVFTFEHQNIEQVKVKKLICRKAKVEVLYQDTGRINMIDFSANKGIIKIQLKPLQDVNE